MAQEEIECVVGECCHMCFSTERKLTSLDGVVDIYLLIVGLTPDCEESVKDVRSCWECRAVLLRILRFRKQAQWARDVLHTADTLLLDKDSCLSKLKFSVPEKINVKRKLTLKMVTNVIDFEISPKCTNSVRKLAVSDDREFFQQDDNEECIEDNINTTNMSDKDRVEEKEVFFSMITATGEDPLAVKIKEEDDIDERNFFYEPLCDKIQTNVDEKTISNSKTHMRNNNNLTSNKESVQNDDLLQNNSYDSTVEPFISSKVFDKHNDSETNCLVLVIDPENFTNHNIMQKEGKDTMLSVTDNVTRKREKNSVLNVEENITLRKENNTVSSVKDNLTLRTEKDAVSSVEDNRTPSGEKDTKSSVTDNLTPRKDNAPPLSINNITSIREKDTELSVKANLKPRGGKVTILSIKDYVKLKGNEVTRMSVKDNLDKDVIVTQHPGENNTMANSNNISMLQSQLNILNIPSNSLQSTNRNINPQLLHNTTTEQKPQIVSKFVKGKYLTEKVLVNGTVKYIVNGNFMPKAVTPRKIIKPDENAEPVMDETHKNIPENMKELYGSFPCGNTESNPEKFRVIKVTKSELNDFLEQARNNEAYLSSPFKCEYCILGFKEERFLQRHMIRYRHAAISKKDFVCNICLTNMSSEKELNIHQSTHKRLYSCTYDDFISVLPLNVYHHYLEKHQFKIPQYNSVFLESSIKLPLASQTFTSQVYRASTPLPMVSARQTKKRELRKKANKIARSKKYEVFKPTIDNFDYKRMMRSLKPSGAMCTDCCIPFRNNEKLFEHRKSHSESAGEHMCDLCRLRFKTAELLDEHKPVHEKWYKCKADPDCHYIAQNYKTIQGHIYHKHPTKPGKRKIYYRSTRNRPEVKCECDVCKKVFTNLGSLKSHLKIHNKKYMCELCGYIGATSTNLIQHKRKHSTGERDYLVCEFCPKRFCDAPSLRYHRSRHLQVKPYACKLCDEKFYSPQLCTEHMSRVHKKNQQNKKKRYQCNLCHLDLPNKWSLTIHRSTHEELQRYKCGRCSKTFFHFNSFVSHQESHVHAHKCDICGKVFVTKDNLECHLHSQHSGGTETQIVKRKRLRECSECGKVFQSVKKWQDHMKTHLIFPEDTQELPEDMPELPEDVPEFPEDVPELPEDVPELPEDMLELPEDASELF